MLQRHSPCVLRSDTNNGQAESKSVETDPVALEDKPVSAVVLEPESLTSLHRNTDNPESSGGDSQSCAANPNPNRQNLSNIFHTKPTQECGTEANNISKAASKSRNEMGTQGDSEFIPNEWVPNVVKPKLPDEEKVCTLFIGAEELRARKPSNLFAVSDDMPSDIRTRTSYSPTPVASQSRSSLTLVSEYLQQRKLRLREHDDPGPSKLREHTGDLQNCKQTIMWARSTHNEGIHSNDLCSVHDEQVIPVPNWKPGDGSMESPKVSSTSRVNEPTSPKVSTYSTRTKPRALSPKVKAPELIGKVTLPNTSPVQCKVHGSGLTNSDINKIFKSVRPVTAKKSTNFIKLPQKGVKPKSSSESSNFINLNPRGAKQTSSNVISNESSNIIDLPPRPPSPVIRGASPFRRNKFSPKMPSPGDRSIQLQADS